MNPKGGLESVSISKCDYYREVVGEGDCMVGGLEEAVNMKYVVGTKMKGLRREE